MKKLNIKLFECKKCKLKHSPSSKYNDNTDKKKRVKVSKIQFNKKTFEESDYCQLRCPDCNQLAMTINLR